MPFLKNLAVIKQQLSQSLVHRYENFRNFIRALSWLNISIGFNLFFGAIFLCLGLILLVQHESVSPSGWVFFAFGLCMILLGLFLLIIRCMFPTKPTSTRTRRRTRPNRIHDSRIRQTSGRNEIWTTPTSDIENQVLSRIIAQLEEGRGRPINCCPPPSYDQATSRQERLNSSFNLPPAYTPRPL
ncbi:hypothetical protein M3Y96_00646800 [Aphelenchoides besseyi]|nr:hypothetical protein M3Y96_00646800 [Aphelenchoides besseyi]